MRRCQHTSLRHLYSGFAALPSDPSGEVAEHPYPYVQIFQCRHCEALQTHIIRDGRAEVRPWTHLPIPALPADAQVALILGSCIPVLSLRPSPTPAFLFAATAR